MNKMDKMLYSMIAGSIGQFVAVVVMIAAGILVFVAMATTSVNMSNTMDDYYREYRFADLFIELTNIPAQKIKELETLDGVERAAGRVVLEAPVITDDVSARVNVRLITSKGEADSLNRCFLLEGRWHRENSREAIVLNQFADARQIRVGDKIRIQSGGARYTLTVVGVAANPEFIYLMESAQSIMPNPDGYGVLYISEAFGQQLAGAPGAYNDALLSYTDAADEESLIKALKTKLRPYGVTRIIKQKDQPSNAIVQVELEQISRISGSIPFVFLAVAGLVLLMMLGRKVKRDRIKIGVLKAMGYSDFHVLLHYVKYALVCGLVGGFAGAVFGMLCAGWLTELFLLYFNIPLLRVDFFPSVVAGSIFLAGVFCAGCGAAGARGILKITPAVSMQSEPPKAGRRIFLERVPFFWKRLSFSWKMIWKNVFRRKRRSAFVGAGVALTYAMILFTTSMPGAIDDMMNKHYSEFQKMDYAIDFKAPTRASAIYDLNHLIDIDYMEGKLEYPFEFENGNKRHVVSVIGLKPDTAFYTFTNTGGTVVTLPETGLLITENLARNLNVGKGDFIKLNTFIPGRQDAYLEVRDVIRQALGLNAYMDIREMGRQLMEKNVVSGVYLDSADEKINEKLTSVPNIASVMSMEEIRSIFEEYMGMMLVSMGTLIVFSGILGFCVVYNATIIAIGEREMEFASLRVLGFGKDEIFKMILGENTMIMIAGVLAGVPLGLSFLLGSSAVFSTDMYTLYMSPTPAALISAAFFTVFFVFIAQVATYRKITKLDLLQALKNRTA